MSDDRQWVEGDEIGVDDPRETLKKLIELRHVGLLFCGIAEHDGQVELAWMAVVGDEASDQTRMATQMVADLARSSVEDAIDEMRRGPGDDTPVVH